MSAASLIGKPREGASAFELGANEKRVARFEVPAAVRVPKLTVYLDGLGAPVGQQVLRGVVYGTDDSLVAAGDEVTVEAGQPAGWVDLPFSGFPEGVELAAGAYDFGVLGGASASLVRVFGDAPADGDFAGSLPLSVSGNEITDASRAAALFWGTAQRGGQTDGLQDDGSFFIGRAATNLFGNGQADVVTGNLAHDPTVTVTIDATTPAPFSPQSFKVVTAGTANGEGSYIQTAAGQAAAAGTYGAGSVWFKGPAGVSFVNQLAWHYTDGTSGRSNAVFVATGSWQLLTPPPWPVDAGKVGDYIFLKIQNVGTVAETYWIAHPMIEKGQPVVAPYVATSGGVTVTKPVSIVQTSPAGLLDPTTGWAAMRLIMGWSGALPPSTFRTIFKLYMDGTQAIELFWGQAGTWLFLSRTDASGTTYVQKVWSPNVGDDVTFIVQWTATQKGISINGVPFTFAADTRNVTATPTALYIGSKEAGIGCIDSRMKWFACGLGTVDDDFSDWVHGQLVSGAEPSPHDINEAFPGAECRGTFPFDDATYLVSQAGRTGVDSYADGASDPFGASTWDDFDLSVFAPWFLPWSVPADATEELYARLPFELSQIVLRSTGTLPGEFDVDATWHSTSADAETGAFAIVDANGPLADLVGERLLVTVRGLDEETPPSVAVFVNSEAELYDADISLTRRTFQELSGLGTNEPLQVRLKVFS